MKKAKRVRSEGKQEVRHSQSQKTEVLGAERTESPKDDQSFTWKTSVELAEERWLKAIEELAPKLSAIRRECFLSFWDAGHSSVMPDLADELKEDRFDSEMIWILRIRIEVAAALDAGIELARARGSSILLAADGLRRQMDAVKATLEAAVKEAASDATIRGAMFLLRGNAGIFFEAAERFAASVAGPPAPSGKPGQTAEAAPAAEGKDGGELGRVAPVAGDKLIALEQEVYNASAFIALLSSRLAGQEEFLCPSDGSDLCSGITVISGRQISGLLGALRAVFSQLHQDKKGAA
jgi:hypothetical protein